jgi:hypothetical protein
VTWAHSGGGNVAAGPRNRHKRSLSIPQTQSSAAGGRCAVALRSPAIYEDAYAECFDCGLRASMHLRKSQRPSILDLGELGQL